MSVRVIYEVAPLKASNIPATWETKVRDRKKQLPPLRNADIRSYNVSLKGKHVGVSSEKHEIFWQQPFADVWHLLGTKWNHQNLCRLYSFLARL